MTDVRAVIGRHPIPVGLMAIAVVSSFIALFTAAFTSEPEERSATVSIRDRTFEFHYRFSDTQARVLDTRFDEQNSTIVMNVDVPNDTEFSTRFPFTLLGALRGEDRRANPYFLVDGEPVTVELRGTVGFEAKFGIHLDNGTKTIEVLYVPRTD